MNGVVCAVAPAQSRVTSVMVCCLILGCVLGGRAAYLQVGPHPRLEAMAKRQFQAKVLVRPRRGAVVDRNGEPLAVNIESNSLAANPSKIKNKRSMAWLLSKVTQIPYAKMLAKLGGDRPAKARDGAVIKEKEFVWIKRHLPESEMAHLKRWRLMDAEGDLVGGLWLVKESKRVYPHGELAAHLLGDVNIDSEGLEGVEMWQNEHLRGKVVSMNAIRDALGRPTFIDAVAARHVKDGEPVQLTIDASLQYAVEQELKAAVHKAGARSGTVIVMNAVNGEILSMANEPSFNPNEHGVPADRRRNRAVTDGYEPGSTMKPVLLAGALTHGMHLSDQIWGSLGTFKVQGKKISEAETHEKFEWLTLKKIIQLSSNVGAAKLALKLGVDPYLSTLQAFGIGARSAIGFPGEISGRLPARKDWQPLTLANIGFGQGLLTTPIQMTRAYAAFANGGWLVQPSLLREPGEGGPKPVAPRRILSEKVAEQTVEALISVTEDKGTGVKARLDGYRVAGKTGTAQVVEPGTGRYSRSRYITSFIGFPVGLEQKIVIFASVDDPKGVYYAAENAAPLFREVLAAVANRFSLPANIDPGKRLATLTDRISTSLAKSVPAPAAPAKPEFKIAVHRELEILATGPTTWRAPSLKGLTAREAARVLQGHRLSLELHGMGVVASQTPEEGRPLAEGDTVRLHMREP